jgi:predicted DNA-binding transcriptional regulator AlpA
MRGAVLLAPDDAARRPTPRRGLSCAESADYIGVSVTKFLEMVEDGRMPKPKEIDRRRVWCIRALDRDFDMLPGGEDDLGYDESKPLPPPRKIVL